MAADPEVVVAAVALVVSLVALLATFMQVMQQYYASAAGYAQCNEKVMGKWAETKSRRFTWDEMRFEVQFDTPVIFVSPPNNKHGPVPSEAIHFLKGTEQSYRDTWADSNMDLGIAYRERTRKEQIHTADNERASWGFLLSAVQRMEAESRDWQQDKYNEMGPPQNWAPVYKLPSTPPSLDEYHTFTVALQRKRKSWDTMPATIARPYATTTMCHLVEMMAALGVYWKEFDRKHDRYRAEGNGFMVLGERLADLGIMFSFQTYGKCEFKAERVIPVDEIKELCFGYVPTIYRETLDQRRLEFPNDEPHNLSSLQMSSRSEIAESLILIGCNNNTIQYFKDEGKRTSHLFPVSFEILGMLSRPFHIQNSVFTYIPNPTPHVWDKRSVSLTKILAAYQQLYQFDLLGVQRNKIIVNRVNKHLKEIAKYQDRTTLSKLRFLKALHTALDDCDEILTARSHAARSATRPSIQARDMSAARIPTESPETNQQGQRREIVQDVLRSHIQEVLRLLNKSDERDADGLSIRTERPPSPGFSNTPRPPPPQFEDMDAASPDDKQHTYMEVYFYVIRGRVVHSARDSTTNRRASVAVPTTIPSPLATTTTGVNLGGPAPPGFGFRRSGTGRTLASSIGGSEPVPPMPNTIQSQQQQQQQQPTENSDSNSVPVSPTAISTATNGTTATNTPTMTQDEPVEEESLANQPLSHDDIWCTLVFRMICWLMLHDFNKADVQVNKSELLGSRMPVYIS